MSTNTQTGQTLAKSTWYEKILFAVGAAGSVCNSAFFSAFITMFYTDSVGIAAGAVGTMMLLCRFLDGISDVLMGVLMEKCHFKMGKARPWLGIAAPLLSMSLVLGFWFPESLSDSGKLVYMYVTYIFATVIAFTIHNVSISALIPRVSLDPEDRQKTATVYAALNQIMSTAIYTIIPLAVGRSGGFSDKSAWQKTTVVFAIVGFIMVMLQFLFTKEKVPNTREEIEQAGAKVDEMPVMQKFAVAAKCRYFWFVMIFWFVAFAITGVSSGINLYYYRYVLGRYELSSLQSSIGMFATMASMTLAPIAYKRFGRMKVMKTVSLCAIVISAARFINPTFAPAFMALSILFNATGGLLLAANYDFVSNVCAYIAKRDGVQVEGIASAFGSVGVKLGSGISAGMVGWILQWGGYDGSLAVQAPETLKTMMFIAIGLPTILEIVKFLTFSVWDLDKKMAELDNK